MFIKRDVLTVYVILNTICLLIAATLTGCKKENKGAIYLTFDDNAVDDWYALADSLQEIGYVATYYVSNYHELGEEQKHKLKQLQKKGHLIAHHSYSHPSLLSYADLPFEVYIQEQIEPQQKAMEADSFTVNHFAYPYGIDLPGSDSILLSYFKSVRKVSYTHTFPLYKHNVSIFPLNKPISAVLWGAGIDKHYQLKEEDIRQAIDQCSKHNKGLLLLAHFVGDDPDHEWQTNTAMLMRVLRYAHAQGVRFGTVDELPVFNPFESGTQKSIR